MRLPSRGILHVSTVSDFLSSCCMCTVALLLDRICVSLCDAMHAAVTAVRHCLIVEGLSGRDVQKHMYMQSLD